MWLAERDATSLVPRLGSSSTFDVSNREVVIFKNRVYILNYVTSGPYKSNFLVVTIDRDMSKPSSVSSGACYMEKTK